MREHASGQSFPAHNHAAVSTNRQKSGRSTMLGDKYTLDIRPTFIDELDRAATYIEQNLGNPVAADKLVNDTYKAIDRALAHPLVTAPRYRPPDVRQPYYAIQVGN